LMEAVRVVARRFAKRLRRVFLVPERSKASPEKRALLLEEDIQKQS
jgi:hypothetical protein